MRRLSSAATPCSTPTDNSISVLQLPPQVKTWYVQYLIRRQMSGRVRSDQDNVPFFKALMSGEVSKNGTHVAQGF
jgi:hypothetical protein